MATMLQNTPGDPSGRISQLLPSVKCSSCNQPVPLAELGDHTCSTPPPVPTLPKPTVSPATVTALLPQRLQGRIAPLSSSTSGPAPSSSPSASTPRSQDPSPRMGLPASDRLKINTTVSPSGPSSFQPRSSPLARSAPDRNETLSARPRDPFTSPSTPLHNRPPQTADPRVRKNSNVGSISSNYSTPTTARPSFPVGRDLLPSANIGPSAPNNSHPPRTGTPSALNGPSNGHDSRPSFNGPPGRNGSPAPNGPALNRNPLGLNGPPPTNSLPPGRNGIPFSPNGPQGPPAGLPGAPSRPYATSLPGRVQTPPQVAAAPPQVPFPLIEERDIDTKTGGEAGMAGVGRRGFAAAARAAMFAVSSGRPLGPQQQPNRQLNPPRFLDSDAVPRTTETPPLSPGSGYSSHSPGPQSPLAQSEFPQSQMPNMTRGTPSPPITAPTITSIAVAPPTSSPITSSFAARLPFFEKLKNIVPGTNASPESTSTPISKNNNHNPDVTTPREGSISATSNSPKLPTRSMSSGTSASRQDREERIPMSPSSGSEYGLAYADSTDYEDDNEGLLSRKKVDPPPPLPLTSSILRSVSGGGRNTRFASISERTDRTDRSDDRTGIRIGISKNDRHERDTSVSSYSSASSAGDIVGRTRTNSAAIAQALGLSRTPPSEYAKLGGPGVTGMGGRAGRSISGSSSGSKSAYSRGTSGLPEAAMEPGGMGKLTMESLLADANVIGRKSNDSYGSGVMRSKSAGKQQSFGGSSTGGSVREIDMHPSEVDDTRSVASGSSRAHRSNTVQGISSPETRPPKLPTRSKTTGPVAERNSSLDANRVKKDRVRKTKVCVRCHATIDDGRWVQVDGGGILCEKCWKNMYLPKCRRCNKSIERQAVSSSDGQLKGKYHKECFNCHTCHKPFPDKTFYVYDGKPLCAYHYHEANDSLCAAARCGQPIEGPCAVSHTGDKYHPEHMTCEYPGYPECIETLSEYWEVDGRMLCERHAHISKLGSDDEGEEQWVQSSRAKKRVTRFIDLAGGGALGSAGAGATPVGGSELM